MHSQRSKVQHPRSKFGFTLIELLIVITIIILFGGMVMASYNSFAETKKLDAELQHVRAAVDLAKGKAQSADAVLCGFDVGPTPMITPNITPFVSQYSVVINGSSSYSLVPTCLDGLTPTPFAFPTLTSGITFPTPSKSIDFLSVGSTAVMTATCIQIQNSSGKIAQLAIQNTGLVEEKIYPSPCP